MNKGTCWYAAYKLVNKTSPLAFLHRGLTQLWKGGEWKELSGTQLSHLRYLSLLSDLLNYFLMGWQPAPIPRSPVTVFQPVLQNVLWRPSYLPSPSGKRKLSGLSKIQKSLSQRRERAATYNSERTWTSPVNLVLLKGGPSLPQCCHLWASILNLLLTLLH